MPIQTSTLRPGLLVSLKTSIAGNVRYAKKTLEAEHIVDGGVQQARWETERTVSDPVEHEAAKKVRSRASALINGVCSTSSFGLLCPEANEDKLAEAIVEARKLAEEFNQESRLTRISVNVLTGRIAPDDVEAVAAINSEISALMADMQSGIERVDVKSIREAANRVKQLGDMLTADAQAKVQIAVETARKAARAIAKADEMSEAQKVDRSAIRKIADMQRGFLDLEEGAEIAAPAQQGRTVEFAE
jgi:soluble cytochrome b562